MSLNIPHVFKAYNEDLKNSKKKTVEAEAEGS